MTYLVATAKNDLCVVEHSTCEVSVVFQIFCILVACYGALSISRKTLSQKKSREKYIAN